MNVKAYSECVCSVKLQLFGQGTSKGGHSKNKDDGFEGVVGLEDCFHWTLGEKCGLNINYRQTGGAQKGLTAGINRR